MAAEPVLVLHGVANRDRQAFETLVAQLSSDIGLDQVRLVPVFWGDLGAALVGLDETLPLMEAPSVQAESLVDGADQGLALGLLAGPPESSVPSADPAEQARLAGAAFEAQLGTTGNLIAQADFGATALRPEFESAWLETAWLNGIGDEAVVREIAAAAAEAVDSEDLPGEAQASAITIPGVSGVVKRVVHALDRAVGAAIGAVGGEVNTFVRAQLAPHLGAFIGDIFVYQRHRAEIHGRVRQVLDREAPGFGGPDRPIPVLAHSLGGVISFDMAVAGDPPLSISPLITFGSQSPLFHVLDPRGGALQPFTPGHPSALPATIGAWANLWGPLDPLAFIAAKVFTLQGGGLPRDTPVQHMASSKLWTHSSYWHSAELVSTAREELAATR